MREPTSIPGLLGGREAEGEAVCVYGEVFLCALDATRKIDT